MLIPFLNLSLNHQNYRFGKTREHLFRQVFPFDLLLIKTRRQKVSGLDSLDLADLAMDCEDIFGISIDLEAAPQTVGDLIDIIKEKTGIDEDE